MDSLLFDNYLKKGMRGHLIGIGGVSMAPLAEVLLGMGLEIAGSDISESTSVDHLRSLGINIKIGHRPENIEGADFIVRTAAAREDNVEIIAARNAGVPVFERAQAWGCIMRKYQNAVCVSGTHGKTTTTSLLTHIYMTAELDPTVMIGGTLPLLNAGHRVGKKEETIIMESCEYYNSFLQFFPTVAIILNIEADHLDFFKDLADVKASFRKFAELVPVESGIVVANGDDANTVDALKGIERRVITFGLTENCDVYAENIKFINAGSIFDIVYDGGRFSVALAVPGIHNVKNAVAASAAALARGISPEIIVKAMKKFHGAARRFEYKGRYNGADVYDDYAHHPGELNALLDMALSLDYEKVVVCFQPHTYSRTKALFDDFVKALSRADTVYLAEIYAAREKNTIGISSSDLADKIPQATYFSSFSKLEEHLKHIAKPGQLIITVGAGDIYRVGEELVK